MNRPLRIRPHPVALAALLLACSFAIAPSSQAHPAAERFIPIGQSPGMSGKYTHTGRITRVKERDHILVIKTDAGEQYEVLMQPQSQIWLDRSKARRATRIGDFDDCRRGRRVEVKYVDGGRDEARVEWIKIESR